MEPTGEMLNPEWEKIAEQIVNAEKLDDELAENLVTLHSDKFTYLQEEERQDKVKVPWDWNHLKQQFFCSILIGQDNRPSSSHLVSLVCHGAVEFFPKCHILQVGLCTTPQCHFLTAFLSKRQASQAVQGGASPIAKSIAIASPNEIGMTVVKESMLANSRPSSTLLSENFGDLYTSHVATAFAACFVDNQIPANLSSVYLDVANGVGADAVTSLQKHLANSYGISPFINLVKCESFILNDGCGADYVKMKQTGPKGLSIVPSLAYASFDGDADRLVYYYYKIEGSNNGQYLNALESNPKLGLGSFRLMDGDNLAALFAYYVYHLMNKLNLPAMHIGVIQTAYANGASTQYLKKELVKF
jgi:phosphoacetylglucosamine mutase